jgi:hypothetical protein
MISFILFAMFAAQPERIAPAEPARAPQLVSSGSMVGMAYGAGKAIYFRASSDSGMTFGGPVKVAEAEVLPLNRHRGPRIVLAGTSLIITAVIGKRMSQEAHGHGLPSDGDLMAWRSADGGKHWSGGVVVNDVPGAAREGLHALAGGPGGRLFAVWLDKRAAEGTCLYGARSDDGGISWSRNILVYSSPDGSICECCHPSVAIDPDGQIFVMWRNWLGGARDMYLARSRDGETFTNAEKLGRGTWQLNACPMDGGGLAIDQGRVVSAWRRDGTLYLAEPGAREKVIGDGKDIALSPGAKGLYASWVGSSGVEVLVPHSAQPELISRSGAAPALAPLDDGSVLVAWEEDGLIKTKRVN